MFASPTRLTKKHVVPRSQSTAYSWSAAAGRFGRRPLAARGSLVTLTRPGVGVSYRLRRTQRESSPGPGSGGVMRPGAGVTLAQGPSANTGRILCDVPAGEIRSGRGSVHVRFPGRRFVYSIVKAPPIFPGGYGVCIRTKASRRSREDHHSRGGRIFAHHDAPRRRPCRHQTIARILTSCPFLRRALMSPKIGARIRAAKS